MKLRAKMRIVTLAAMALSGIVFGGDTYTADWASLDSRPTPKWWQEAKFGIFVHWGPYAVPAFAPTDDKNVYDCYAEWYQGQLIRSNAVVTAHHERFYNGRPYANFAADFRAENFDPEQWAALFKKAGAKYAVLTSKHHDGFALWPSPESPYYNAVAMGPGRDLAGDFTAAMHKAGLKSGFYYSLIEYANPLHPRKMKKKPIYGPEALDIREWCRRVNIPQLKELVENYHADIIWPDGEWDYTDEEYLSKEFLAWLFNESSMKDTVVVNDRWGRKLRGHHGGHFTTEYGDISEGTKAGEVYYHPWEECRGLGRSFGFNRYERSENYMTREQCIKTLVSVVSRGGNLLLNVGPTADGRIPAIMEDRLLAIGRWLEVNGEAIYGSKRWEDADRSLSKQGIYFTKKVEGGIETVYAIVFGLNDTIRFKVPRQVSAVTRLGSTSAENWKFSENRLSIVRDASTLPPESYAIVYKIVFN